jgi:hypothetical protein
MLLKKNQTKIKNSSKIKRKNRKKLNNEQITRIGVLFSLYKLW